MSNIHTAKVKKRHSCAVQLTHDQADRIKDLAAKNPIYEISVSIKRTDEALARVQFQSWTEDHSELTKKIVSLLATTI